MTAADVTTLRRQACAMIAALGPVLDALQTLDETCATPTTHAPEDDALLVLAKLNEAVEGAELFADNAGTFVQYLIAHQHEQARHVGRSLATENAAHG